MAVQTGIVSHIQLNLALVCEEAAALPSQGFLPLTCLLGNSWGTEHTLPHHSDLRLCPGTPHCSLAQGLGRDRICGPVQSPDLCPKDSVNTPAKKASPCWTTDSPTDRLASLRDAILSCLEALKTHLSILPAHPKPWLGNTKVCLSPGLGEGAGYSSRSSSGIHR